MAELADAPDLESGAERLAGSTPVTRTSDESVRTIRTLYININSIWVDFLFYKNHPTRKGWCL